MVPSGVMLIVFYRIVIMQIYNHFIAMIAFVAIFVFTFDTKASNDIYSHEAASFLMTLPENLQKRQATAIRMAMAGKRDSLDAIRMSRNVPSEPHAGVIRRPIGDNMALFRSDIYDNDTIPLLLYFHGGGWTIGSINSCSRFCSRMALNGVAVLAVDYRLAPEHPYPDGLTDCIAAAKIAADSLDRWKCRGMVAGGDSSGGNLAIATALSLPDNTFDGLILFYPVIKAYPDNSPSWQKYGCGFGLDSDLMETFNDAYTSDIYNPMVSPAMASDRDLRKLPPILIVSAECDILKDQGQEFAGRLRILGNDVSYVMIPGSVHLFITVPGQPAAFNYAVSAASTFSRNVIK